MRTFGEQQVRGDARVQTCFHFRTRIASVVASPGVFESGRVMVPSGAKRALLTPQLATPPGRRATPPVVTMLPLSAEQKVSSLTAWVVVRTGSRATTGF